MDGDLPALDPVEVRGPVRTDRLVLRPFTPDDVVAIEAYAASPGARPHLAGSACDPGRMLADRLGWTRLAEVGDRLALAIELPAQGQRWSRVVGEVHLLLRDPGARQAELGVVLHEDVRGAGVAVEAADRILELAFAEVGVHRVACGSTRRTRPRSGWPSASACGARGSWCTTGGSAERGPIPLSSPCSTWSGRLARASTDCRRTA